MSQILVGRCSAHATACTRTILSQPESYLSKLLISAKIRMSQALVGRYSAHALASTRTILSLPEPPLYRSPLFSILDFSVLCSHCSVASRHASRASTGLTPIHANGLWHWPRFSPLRVYVYHYVLIRLFCRRLLLTARCSCVYHVSV